MNAPRESFQAALTCAASRHEPRHAALLLHTLGLDDRQWLLDRLPADERARLVALVAELESIGIPPAPDLLDDLSPARVRPAGGRALPGLANATPEDVDAVLSSEPVDLVARVFALGAWPWIDDVLARIPAPRRQQVLEARRRLDAPTTGSRSVVDKRLLELVEARLASAAADRAARLQEVRPSVPRPAAGAPWRWLEPLFGSRAGSRRS